MKTSIAAFAASFVVATSFAQTPTGQQLAEQLDRVRRPEKSFEVRMTITELRDGKPDKSAAFQLYTRRSTTHSGFDVVTLTLEPESDRNKTILTLGRDVWLFDPKSTRPVQISPTQFKSKFFVADALSTSFAAEYESEYLGEETVANAAHKDRVCHHIKMKLRDKAGNTPETIEYWIDKELGMPVRGQFHSGNGKLLRTAYYAAYTKVLGALRPMRVLVISGVERGLVTDIRFSNLALRESPEKMFIPDSLRLVSEGKLP